MISKLRPTDMVYLHALLPGSSRAGGLMLSAPGSVAPNEAFYWYLIGHLERQGLIVAAPTVRAVKGFGAYATPAPRRYELAADLPAYADLKLQLEGALKALRKDPASIHLNTLLWQELALAELHAYIEWELACHRFDARWGDCVTGALEQGLMNFSIGQMFYFCWTTVRDLASHHLRNPAPFETYKDYLVNAITGKIERAVRDGWEVRQYSRQWKRSTNAVAETFANHATNLGGRFLSEVPGAGALTTLF